MHLPRSFARLACCASCLWVVAATSGCPGPGQFVWFSDLPASTRQAPTEYLVADGDTISIRVLGHEDMSVHEKVRGDGRIALPIIGEVDARGKRPSSLRSEIEGRLKDYIVSPSVMLNVDEKQPISVAVLGEVGKPGQYSLDPNANIADALAACGGLTEYATRDRIFLVRQRPAPLRIRFTYDWVSRNEGQAASFVLQPGDLVVVE
jgi:polysaccharide biosynthesis/export protein